MENPSKMRNILEAKFQTISSEKRCWSMHNLGNL